MISDSVFIEKALFFLFGGAAVLFSLLMITRKNPMSAAICLVVTLLAIAGLYAMLGAAFVALLQVLVYAGAIMMLIIFVIMTLNLRDESLLAEKPVLFGGLVAGAVLLFCFGRFYAVFVREPLAWSSTDAREMGTVENLGRTLFTRHVLSFEIVSLLLLVALVGIVVLVQKRKDPPARKEGE